MAPKCIIIVINIVNDLQIALKAALLVMAARSSYWERYIWIAHRQQRGAHLNVTRYM